MRKTITPPKVDATDVERSLKTLAEAYGEAIAQADKRSNISYAYEDWVNVLEQLRPIDDYSLVTKLIDSYVTPASLIANSDDTPPLKKDFEARFLRIAAADMITHAYCEGNIETIPPRLFEQLLETPDHQPEPTTAATTAGVFANEHPNVSYQDHILNDGLDDFASLFSHLEILWLINPQDAHEYWRTILKEGHPLEDNENPPNRANTWKAALAQSFAGAILSNPDRPVGGLIEYPYMHGEQIKEKVNYPHDNQTLTNLAKITAKHINLDNIYYDSTIEDITSYLPDEPHPSEGQNKSDSDPKSPNNTTLMNDPTKRFRVVVDIDEESERAWHIIDKSVDYNPSELMKSMMNEDQQKFRRLQEQNICPHNGNPFGTPMPLSEVNNHLTTSKEEFSGEVPDEICSYCWNKVQELIAKHEENQNLDISYDTAGFRLRWKQVGRAREEWIDLIVSPETTFQEMDSHVINAISTLDRFHVRLYGLEGEFENSSLDIYGNKEHAADIVDKRPQPVTIKEIFSEYTLSEGDRLSMVYDLGTPLHYYCIIKETLSEEELNSILTDPETKTKVVETTKNN